MGGNGSVVLGSETGAEGTGFGFAIFKVGANGDENDDDERNRGDDKLGIRKGKIHRVLLCRASSTGESGW
jgi:hypothetical protein